MHVTLITCSVRSAVRDSVISLIDFVVRCVRVCGRVHARVRACVCYTLVLPVYIYICHSYCKPTFQYSARVCIVMAMQGIVTLIGPIEPFATGIKMKSRDQQVYVY